MLLKPWCDLQKDLKPQGQLWSTAFSSFITQSPDRIWFILSNIHYFYKCKSAATKQRNGEIEPIGHDAEMEYTMDDRHEGHEGHEGPELSEEGLNKILMEQMPWREKLHGALAIEAAKQAKVFPNNVTQWVPSNFESVGSAMGEDIRRLVSWREQMKHDILS